MARPHRTTAKTERNERLRRDFQEGVPVPELLARYRITRQRLYQLVPGGRAVKTTAT